MLARVMCDIQFRIKNQQLLQFVFHRQYATYDNRTLCVNVGIALEHFRKTFIHTTRNILMLLRSKRRKLAKTLV